MCRHYGAPTSRASIGAANRCSASGEPGSIYSFTDIPLWKSASTITHIEKRGILKNQVYLSPDRVELSFELPLAEIVFDFYDRLKTVSKGYASFDYQPIGYQKSNLVKMDILLNGDQVDALSALIHRDNAHNIGKKICVKL